READALRRSHALQRDLLNRLSHELRTPLTAVQGFAESLLQADVSWDESSQRRFLTAIAGESERMRRLVGDLLDSAAISSGVLRLAADWCDLELVLRAAIAITPGQVELSLPAALPKLWGDHDRLEQVFVNLLDNAARHAETEEPVRVSVRLDPLEPGEALTVSVRVADRGRGVPAEVAARLFMPYARGPTGGAGLGLSISRGVVEAHGGRLELGPSRVGACFRVVLPVERDPADMGAATGTGAILAVEDGAHG
ncbi:MAG: sensor histidine kinase, partial [Egibacteraceae bacterium]